MVVELQMLILVGTSSVPHLSLRTFSMFPIAIFHCLLSIYGYIFCKTTVLPFIVELYVLGNFSKLYPTGVILPNHGRLGKSVTHRKFAVLLLTCVLLIFDHRLFGHLFPYGFGIVMVPYFTRFGSANMSFHICTGEGVVGFGVVLLSYLPNYYHNFVHQILLMFCCTNNLPFPHPFLYLVVLQNVFLHKRHSLLLHT